MATKNNWLTWAIVLLILIALWWWWHTHCPSCQAALTGATSAGATPPAPLFQGPVTTIMQALNTGGYVRISVPGINSISNTQNLPADAIVTFLNSAEQPAAPSGAQAAEIAVRFPGLTISSPAQAALISTGSQGDTIAGGFSA